MDMSKRKSLQTTRPKESNRRAKPLVAKAGATRSRTPYKCGGKASK